MSVKFFTFRYAGLALAAALASSSAFAVLTVTPTTKGGKPVSNGTAYYASTDTVGTSQFGGADQPFPDPVSDDGFPYAEVNIAATNTTEAGSLASAISFDIASTTATLSPPVAGANAVIMISMTGTNGAHYASMAGAGFTSTNTAGCLGRTITASGTALNYADTGRGHCYGVGFNGGTTLSVQLYPKDLCWDYGQQVGVGSGCSTNDVATGDPAAGTAAVPIQLTFKLVWIDAAGAINSEVESATLNLVFQKSMQKWTCAGSDSLSQSLFPADGAIELNTTSFNGVTSTGIAPMTDVVAVGKLYSGGTANAPTLDKTFATSNDVYSHVPFAETASIGPLKNTGVDGTFTYTLGFMVRDATGMVSPLSTTGTACTLGPVQATQVRTFLAQSKCFIATAAFRSMDAAPVALLREFRDEVLSKSELGRQFIDWYYDWSPPAAEWLLRHPSVRLPILEALVPVEVVAWFMLHPVHLTVLLVTVGSALVLGLLFTLLHRARSRHGGNGEARG